MTGVFKTPRFWWGVWEGRGKGSHIATPNIPLPLAGAPGVSGVLEGYTTQGMHPPSAPQHPQFYVSWVWITYCSHFTSFETHYLLSSNFNVNRLRLLQDMYQRQSHQVLHQNIGGWLSRRPAHSTYLRLTHKPWASYGYALGLSDWRLVSRFDCVGTPE